MSFNYKLFHFTRVSVIVVLSGIDCIGFVRLSRLLPSVVIEHVAPIIVWQNLRDKTSCDKTFHYSLCDRTLFTDEIAHAPKSWGRL